MTSRYIEFNSYEKELLEFAKASSHESVAVDAGCGDGSISSWLASIGYEVIAFDISLVPDLTSRSPMGGRISWIEQDLFTFEPLRHFDTVVLLNVLHYAGSKSRVDDMLSRTTSWLKPNGLYLLSWIADDFLIPESSAFLPPIKLVLDQLSLLGFHKLHLRERFVEHQHGGPMHRHNIVYSAWRSPDD
jgi:2-polyprenyl-3-methyl-5-hydroxy-6-metoxy-1,4-benzoquinol methylase